MKLPLWLIALLFLGYCVWCAYFWNSYQIRNCCGEAAAALSAAKQTDGTPLFRWNADKPEPDDKFAAWKKTQLAKGGQGDTLVITGFYRSGETNGEQLALARAAAIRDMMAPELPANRTRLAAQMVTDSLSESSGPMASASFSWTKMVLKKEDSAIIESDQDVILLFPFNSTERDRDAKVDAYLKELCIKHKSLNTTFNVVGYTDDVGTDEENKALGLGRAKSVGAILQSNGIAANRISISSQGEANPVADNKTEEGRRQNRRVVITVNR